MNSDVAVDPVVIGRFGKSFGVLGWIKVISFATPKENILKFKPLLMQKNGSWEEFCFKNSRKHADNIIVKLPGCGSPEEASRFTNVEIGIWRKQLPKLKDNEYYWSDLVGLEVINKESINLGVVKDLMATGSNDVLIVIGKDRILIPYLSNVVLKVDLASKIINVDWAEDFL